MTIPMIPVSSALGGGLMPCFKRGPAPGACTTVNCGAKATTKCGHTLTNGQLCGRSVCDKHAHVVQIGRMVVSICPPHARLTGQKVGR